MVCIGILRIESKSTTKLELSLAKLLSTHQQGCEVVVRPRQKRFEANRLAEVRAGILRAAGPTAAKP